MANIVEAERVAFEAWNSTAEFCYLGGAFKENAFQSWLAAKHHAAQVAEPAPSGASVDSDLYAAVAKLIKAKGRFHTEQNYAALVAAFDRVVPRASVDSVALDAARYRAWRACVLAEDNDFARRMNDAMPAEVGDTREPTADEWDAAMDAAMLPTKAGKG